MSIPEQYTQAPEVQVPAPQVIAEPIPGARVMQLRWHADERGALCEVHRDSWTPDWPKAPDADRTPQQHVEWIGAAREAERFHNQAPQVYVSETQPGVVKGWHLHPAGLDCDQTDRFSCIAGRIRLVLVDLRPGGDPTPVEIVLDPARRMLRVEIPPGVAHGWICLSDTPAMVINAVSRAYDGLAEYRCDPHGPPGPVLPVYDWRARRDG